MSGQKWTETPPEGVGADFFETACNHGYHHIKRRAEEMPEPEPLIGNMARGQVGFLAGPAGSGKSLFAMSLAAAACTNTNLGEWKPGADPALKLGFLVDAELTPYDLASRIELLGMNNAPITYNYSDSRDMTNMPPFLLGDAFHQAWLMHCAAAFDVVVIDNVTFTLEPAPGHNIYAPETINQMRPLFNWARSKGKLLILIDHTNSEGKLSGSMNKHRLADWVGLMDVQPLQDDQAANFDLKFEKWRGANRPRRDTNFILGVDGKWESKEILSLPEQIRELIEQGASKKECAEELDISIQYVRKISKTIGRR